MAHREGARNRRRLRRAKLVVAGAVLCWIAVVAVPAQAMQVGANPSTTGATIGTNADIHQPSVTWNGSYARAYWVAATLPDGTFLQAGYADTPPSWGLCPSGLSWFVTILLADGSHVGDLWNTGDCGLTGSHRFAVVRIPPPPGSGSIADTFILRMDGNRIGPGYSNPLIYTFARPNAGDVSELVSTTRPPSGTPFPQVEYTHALGVEWTDGTWHYAADAHAFRSSDAACPPYYLAVYAPNDFATGNDPSTSDCPRTYDPLW